jgi:hypothetical protein
MFSKTIAPIAAAILALCAVGAQAASTLKVTGSTFGSDGLYIDRTSTNDYLHVDAGAVNLTFNGLSFMSYCVDVYQAASFGVTYTDYAQVSGVSQFGATKANDLGRLFTSYGSLVDTKIESVAMQLAVWEIVDETGSVGYNINGYNSRRAGTFSAFSDGDTNLDAFRLANSWLSNLGTSNAFTVSALHSDSAQDFLVLAPVPEPSTYALMLAGLAGVGFVARRRRNGAGR